MAYPTVSAPYGLQPINRFDGMPYAGATQQLPIASTYNTAIYNGDIVNIASGGTVAKSTVTVDSTTAAANYTAGVFMGCQYTSATTGQLTFSQYYPASLAVKSGSTILAFVADDPDQLFKVALVAGQTEDGNGLTIAFLGRTVIGSNLELVQNSGSSVTGDSKIGAYSAAGATTTDTLPLRCIDVVPDTANSSGNFCEVIVKWNAANVSGLTGGHQYLNPTGV